MIKMTDEGLVFEPQSICHIFGGLGSIGGRSGGQRGGGHGGRGGGDGGGSRNRARDRNRARTTQRSPSMTVSDFAVHDPGRGKPAAPAAPGGNDRGGGDRIRKQKVAAKVGAPAAKATATTTKKATHQKRAADTRGSAILTSASTVSSGLGSANVNRPGASTLG